ncbi:hypothetical protein PMG11_11240 [Penicillium brasilianum]|uniref:Protein kinase domain-containing protein n=1 Tax=Penicillium brasilianum TaxID=104259 RepID=A0A0F7U196_PENBI|nr:hypothetical protein PMG11_11240 [Penicillium brasilianum]
MRYTKVAVLGSGQFGIVYKAIDIDAGKLLVVKILQQPDQAANELWRQSVYYALKREVETLSRISHGWDGPLVEIFMGLKEGNLRSLVNNGTVLSITDLAHCVFHQMLQALDCLAVHEIVHRDVKPENILYTSLPGAQYHFQLGDFGLCNRTVSAVTSVGTPLYMAPEVPEKGNQTHMVDVWSLFVTMAWTLDVEGFHLKSEKFVSIQEVHQAISSAALKIEIIQEMARVDPHQRASAAQMLLKCFDGNGLVTPGHRITPIDLAKAETKASTALLQAPRPAAMCQGFCHAPKASNKFPDRCRVLKPRALRHKQAGRILRPTSANRIDFPPGGAHCSARLIHLASRPAFVYGREFQDKTSHFPAGVLVSQMEENKPTE